jgi:hypothetical protein
MTSLSQIPNACKALLDAFQGLPSLEVLVRKSKEIENDISAVMDRIGVCIYVMPVLPRRVSEGADFIFFEEAEVRVRIIENTLVNDTGLDIYELMAQVALCLHGKNPGDLLADNLRLATTPIEGVEDPEAAVFDVLFTAAFQLNP